ncbi:hypothetical protein PanWU01x14_263380 [Parasponia andersonii]|uniref:Uncharacterized protein n=1 Tax=Parasponia andersonii TaxID=3476 RepID=A0A2P5B7S9_PARAD|nr:hypothetical protein PanWU01x14_263380 [Parasponia andersonii]
MSIIHLMAIANVICFLLFCVNRFIRTLKLKSSAAARTRAAAAMAEAAVTVTGAAAAVAAARAAAFLAAREIRHNEFLELMRLPNRRSVPTIFSTVASAAEYTDRRFH